MTPSNPFDFSEFGGRPRPAPPPEPESDGLLGGPPPGAHPAPYAATGGFDPFASQPPVARPAAEEIFRGSAVPGSLTVAGPPLPLFGTAFVAAAVGAVLGAVAVITDAPVPLAFAGWLLAGPAAIGVLAWFSGVDTRRRLSSVYSSPTWLSTGYWVVVATCAAGIGIGAWEIALWAGRY